MEGLATTQSPCLSASLAEVDRAQSKELRGRLRAMQALGSMGEKARARRLLEQAVALKEQWVGSTEHPSESVQPQDCALADTSNMHEARAGLCLLVLSSRLQA